MNGHFKVFKTARTIWVKSSTKDTKVQGKSKDFPESEILENIALIRVVQDHYIGHSKVFLDSQGHLGEVCHLEAFGTIRNAREASGAQRCELVKMLSRNLRKSSDTSNVQYLDINKQPS